MILYKIKKNNKLNLLSKSYLIYLNCYYTNRFSSNFVAKKYLLNEINNYYCYYFFFRNHETFLLFYCSIYKNENENKRNS